MKKPGTVPTMPTHNARPKASTKKEDS